MEKSTLLRANTIQETLKKLQYRKDVIGCFMAKLNGKSQEDFPLNVRNLNFNTVSESIEFVNKNWQYDVCSDCYGEINERMKKLNEKFEKL